MTKGIEGLFRKNKVTYLKGSGAYLDANTIEVTAADGKTENITVKKSIIATGSEPTAFPGLTYDEKIIVSSTGALSFPAIPKDLVVIGGGVIGLEMASIYQRFGSNVTVIEYLDEIVPSLDK